MANLRILWNKNKDGNAVIYRIYGTDKNISIPSHIGDVPVAGLGDYCFAAFGKIPSHVHETYIGMDSRIKDYLREIGGEYLESVSIPDRVTDMGNFAFYNCRNLKKIETGASLINIGSDVFMNCTNLYDIILRCSAVKSTGLQQILLRTSSQIRATFMDEGKTDAVFIYPEYFETYDEIAPAHIFGRNIEGEGFRARQCFDNGKINAVQYDGVFDKASVEEGRDVVFMMAFQRLVYPFNLNNTNRLKYEGYIKQNEEAAVKWLVSIKWLDALERITKIGILSAHALEAGVTEAVKEGWGEGTAFLMRLMHKSNACAKKSRYEF